MLTNNESPLENIVAYDTPDDGANNGEMPEGQVSEESIEDSSVIEEQPTEQPESFFVYKDDDGNEQTFKSQDELREYIRSGTLRHADYTKKTQSVAEQRKALEAERQKYDVEYTTFLQQKQEYDKIEKYLKSLPPDVYNRLKQEINSQPKQQQQEFKDPRLDKLLEQQEMEKKQREEQVAREQAIKSLKNVYQDFNEDEIMKEVNRLQEIAPGDSVRAFLELVYYARKGKETPAQIERKTAELLERKSRIATPIGATSSTPSKGLKQFSNLDEAAEAAYNDL